MLLAWNGVVWLPVVFPTNGSVDGLLDLANGDVVVHGTFTTAGGVPAQGIARWSGSTWSPLGAGVPPGQGIGRVLELQNRDLLAIGSFGSIGGVQTRGIARWDGAAWHALGGGAANVVSDAIELANGDLLALGGFQLSGGFVSGVLRWDGAAWSVVGDAVGGGAVAMLRLVNGDLLVGGAFTGMGGVPAAGIARWNGSVWSPVGAGCAGLILALANAGAGDIAVGGTFTRIDGEIATNFARLVSLCPATVASLGSGCAATGSPSVYAATAPAWLGATYRARGSNLPEPAIAAVVTGFQTTSIPLAQLLSPSPSGCTLLVVPDFGELALVTADVYDTSFAVPNVPTLVGVVLHQQLLFAELDANAVPIRSSSTNGLTVTIGAF